jgi:hypothetical protein
MVIRMKKNTIKNKHSNVVSNNYTWMYLLIVFVVTVIAFWPSVKNGFTNWDDPTYLINNPVIRALTGESIKQMFTQVYFSNYQPLHLLSYAVEYRFFWN